jgi:hypothetical protein
MEHLILPSDILIAYVKDRLNREQVLLLEEALLHQPEASEEVLWLRDMLEQEALDDYLELQGWEDLIDYEALFDANLKQAESLSEITTEEMVAYVKGELPKEAVLILEEKLLIDAEQQDTLFFLQDLHKEGMLEEGLVTMEKGWTTDIGDVKEGTEEGKPRGSAGAERKLPFSFLQIAATLIGILLVTGIVVTTVLPPPGSDDPLVRPEDVMKSDDAPKRPIRGGYVTDQALERALTTNNFDTPGKKLRVAAYLLDYTQSPMGPFTQKVLWENYYLLPARNLSVQRRFEPVEHMAFLEGWQPADQLPLTNDWMTVDWKQGELIMYHPDGPIIGSVSIDAPKQLGWESSGKALWVLSNEGALTRLRTPEGIWDWLRSVEADFIPPLTEQERQAAIPNKQ